MSAGISQLDRLDEQFSLEEVESETIQTFYIFDINK